ILDTRSQTSQECPLFGTALPTTGCVEQPLQGPLEVGQSFFFFLTSILILVPSGRPRIWFPICAPPLRLSPLGISRTLASDPPSAQHAGGYSSLSCCG